jgi:hypothetical protein
MKTLGRLAILLAPSVTSAQSPAPPPRRIIDVHFYGSAALFLRLEPAEEP